MPSVETKFDDSAAHSRFIYNFNIENVLDTSSNDKCTLQPCNPILSRVLTAALRVPKICPLCMFL